MGVLFFLATPIHAYWQLIGLGDISRDNYSHLSINNSGQIVGDICVGGSDYHACLYDYSSGGTLTDLGTLGGSSSHADSINESGQIVGGAISDNQWHGCIFDASGNGANFDLGAGLASCINNSGRIVGGFYGAQLIDINDPDFHLYLGGLSQSHPGSNANSINDNGQIVGSGGTDSGQVHACLFDASGEGDNIDLGTLGGNLSYANSVNNTGLIVGTARVDSGFTSACLFDSTGNGDNVDLGTLGGYASYGKAINNHNQIIGYASTDTPSGRFHATLFDASGNGANIDLNDLIDPLSGWELIYGHDINDNGWIVGWGIPPQGGMEAFLLIPEPCTLSLLALGGLTVAWRKRKAN